MTMGKEPAHLMAIFKGKMVVYMVSAGLWGRGGVARQESLWRWW